MRRRRNAASASSDTEATSSLDTRETRTDAAATEESAASAPEQGTIAADAAATPASEDAAPKPRRRSSSRRNKSAATVEAGGEAGTPPAAPVETAAAAPAAADAEPPTPETPAKPRRTRRRAAAAEPDTPTAQEPTPPPATAAAPVVPVSEQAPPPMDAVAPAGEETPAEKPRRTRRRSSAKQREEAAAAAEEPTLQPSVLPGAHAPAAQAPEIVVSAATEAAEAPAATEAPAGGEGPSARRTRGRHRVGKVDPAAAEAATTAEPPATETPAPTAEAEPGEAAAEETARPRRVRGQRTGQQRRRGTTTVGAAPVPTVETPAEPLTPAYQPLPAETLARLAETRVAVRKGVPELIINGEPRLPLWFFVNTEMDPEGARDTAIRQIRLAYESGVRAFSLLAHLPWRSRAGERRYGPLDDMLQLIADHAPEAFVLPRLIFSPPVSWERANPDEMTRYEDGETGDVSLASRAFWEGEAEEALRAAVEHVAQGPHAGRVFGFYLEHGEWFYEKGRGFDVSPANQERFREWLRERYKNNVVLLRAAWHDGAATFDSATVPPPPPPPGSSLASPNTTLFYSPREQRWVDFYEYGSELIAGVIQRLGEAVKEASGGRSAVAVSYGYTLELTRAHSGHLALGKLLSSPVVDILTGPISYAGRAPGGSAPFPVPIDSVTLAGKLWVSEDDTKTHLAGDDTPDAYNPKVANAEGTAAVHARNFGAALAHGAGISWMDLWGEGWLDDRAMWQRLGRLREIADRLATRRRNPRTRAVPEPDVAVIVDERSFADVRAEDVLLTRLIANQRDALLRSGARIGFYLLSDLLRKNFPSGPRLFVFLNAFRMPDEVRAAIREKVHGGGRTLAFLYGPGSREANLSELADVIGMHLRLQPWGSKTGSVITDGRSPLTDGLKGERIGEEARVNPSYMVGDPKAQVLGEYAGSGNPSIAVRRHENWQSVFIGEAQLSLPLLRGLYRLAGVPIYTVDDDTAVIGDNLIALHSAPGGGTTVYLPEDAALFDALTGETLASGGYGARLSVPMRGTRILFYGPPADVSRLGGDSRSAPPGLTRDEASLAAAPVPPFGPGAPSSAGTAAAQQRAAAAPSEEDERLMAAAFAGEIPALADIDVDDEDEEDLLDADGEAADEAAAASASDAAPADAAGAKKKRRRRRRGRGRRGEEEAEGEGPAGSVSREAMSEAERIAASVLQADGLLTDNGDADDAAPARRLPPLEELLPLSGTPVEEGDLPPIPDEFLPLGGAAAAETAAEAASADDAELADSVSAAAAAETEAPPTDDTPPAPARRSRSGGSGGRSRRGGTGGGAGGGEASSTEAAASREGGGTGRGRGRRRSGAAGGGSEADASSPSSTETPAGSGPSPGNADSESP